MQNKNSQLRKEFQRTLEAQEKEPWRIYGEEMEGWCIHWFSEQPRPFFTIYFLVNFSLYVGEIYLWNTLPLIPATGTE